MGSAADNKPQCGAVAAQAYICIADMSRRQTV